jgi:hypothetical protein
MSWSVAAIGKAPAARREVATQFAAASKSVEPEEKVRLAAIAALDAALAAQGPEVSVNVSAHGSQSTDYATNAVTNYLRITVEPQL